MSQDTSSGENSAQKFENLALRNVEFRNADLTGAKFTDVSLKSAAFEDINLQGATLHNVNFSQVTLSDVNIEGLVIEGFAIDRLIAGGTGAAGGEGGNAMTNKKLAAALKELGDLLVIAGQDEAKAARYARLAYTVSRLSEEVETLCEDGRLCDIPGVGPATAALLSELLLTGTCRMRRDWERRVPPSALELLTIPGIGARTARHLFQDCGIDSLAALEKAVARGAIPGLDARAAATLRTYFRHYARRQAGQTLSLLLEDDFEAAIGVRQ